mmetsp:Transcript_23721/g.72484  ORF Transcript_23721/g.72484 Transcript_23721/m.72484 type:complete len:2032 (-) Transcript_23721:126-6221(-)
MQHEHHVLLHLWEAEGFQLEPVPSWRMRERIKTSSLVLVLALNLGVDPPDVIKPNPCARLECWIDPQVGQKAIDAIAKALQAQYEQWQPRALIRACLDPTPDEVRKWCLSLRRSAPGRDERLLLHFNGHGVPRPTTNGEVWLFNRSFTQYNPVSIYDLQTWLGPPCALVFDCSNAGRLSQALASMLNSAGSDTTPSIGVDVILLCACGADEELPTSPELPADLFTACLTSPMRVALQFASGDGLVTVPPHLIANGLPGSPNDRRSPAGELNWVFTAITDAIAWASLPRELFRRLFRQDMLLASLFRNFLLAQRILGRFNLHPTSAPPIPSTHNHPLWDSWDLAVETSIVQMNAATKAAHAAAAAAVTEAATASMGLGAGSKAAPSGGLSASAVAADVGNSTTCRGAAGAVAREPGAVGASTSADALKAGGAGSRAQPAAAVPSSGELMASAATMASPMAIIVPPSSFFAEQLLAFETWLTRGVDRESAPTEQLLVLLQVLLSPTHRHAALVLLARFVAIGPWAVRDMLDVGFFPYLLKLLLSPAGELRPSLLYLWSAILLFDRSVRSDLVRDNAHAFFISVLRSKAARDEHADAADEVGAGQAGAAFDGASAAPHFRRRALGAGGQAGAMNAVADPRAAVRTEANVEASLALFVLADICDRHPQGQAACLRLSLPTHLAGLLRAVLSTLSPSAISPRTFASSSPPGSRRRSLGAVHEGDSNADALDGGPAIEACAGAADGHAVQCVHANGKSACNTTPYGKAATSEPLKGRGRDEGGWRSGAANQLHQRDSGGTPGATRSPVSSPLIRRSSASVHAHQSPLLPKRGMNITRDSKGAGDAAPEINELSLPMGSSRQGSGLAPRRLCGELLLDKSRGGSSEPVSADCCRGDEEAISTTVPPSLDSPSGMSCLFGDTGASYAAGGSAAQPTRSLITSLWSAPSGSEGDVLFWLCLCVAMLCEGNAAAQAQLQQSELPALLAQLLGRPEAIVRAAAIHAMTALCSLPAESDSPTRTPTCAVDANRGSGVRAMPAVGTGVKGLASRPSPATSGVTEKPAQGTDLSCTSSEAWGVGDGGVPEWRLHLGTCALRAQRDGSALVRAQLCGLLGAICARFPLAMERASFDKEQTRLSRRARAGTATAGAASPSGCGSGGGGRWANTRLGRGRGVDSGRTIVDGAVFADGAVDSSAAGDAGVSAPEPGSAISQLHPASTTPTDMRRQSGLDGSASAGTEGECLPNSTDGACPAGDGGVDAVAINDGANLLARRATASDASSGTVAASGTVDAGGSDRESPRRTSTRLSVDAPAPTKFSTTRVSAHQGSERGLASIAVESEVVGASGETCALASGDSGSEPPAPMEGRADEQIPSLPSWSSREVLSVPPSPLPGYRAPPSTVLGASSGNPPSLVPPATRGAAMARTLCSQIAGSIAFLARDPFPRIASRAKEIASSLAAPASCKEANPRVSYAAVVRNGGDGGPAGPPPSCTARAAGGSGHASSAAGDWARAGELPAPCAALLPYARRRLARAFPGVGLMGELLPSANDPDAATAQHMLAACPVGGGIPLRSAAAQAAVALAAASGGSGNSLFGGGGGAAKKGSVVASLLHTLDQDGADGSLSGTTIAMPSPSPNLEPQGVLGNAGRRISALALHSTAPLLIVASGREDISVWDTRRRSKLHGFSNGNTAGSRIHTLLLLDERSFCAQPTLAVGTSDGCVRLWRAYDQPHSVHLLTAWQASAVPGIVAASSADGCGPAPRDTTVASLAWQPSRALMAAAGGPGVEVNMWDVRAEQLTTRLSLPAGSSCCITSLAADSSTPIILAGGSDGILRALDPRAPPTDCVVASFVASRSATAPIATVQIQPGPSLGRLVVAATTGDIWLIDPRRVVPIAIPTFSGREYRPATVHTRLGHPPWSAASVLGDARCATSIDSHRAASPSISSLALHPTAPTLATASMAQFIKIFDLNGAVPATVERVSAVADAGYAMPALGPPREMSTIRYYDGFLGARIAPVTALAFHPVRNMLVGGATDGIITLYADGK